MDGKFQTSFIPRSPLQESGGPKPVHRLSLLTLIGGIIFVTVLLLAGAVFAYERYLAGKEVRLEEQLKAELKKFDPALTKQLKELDTQIETAKFLLKDHLALSQFFDFLGQVTLRSVRFSSFSYTSGNGKIMVSMAGQAQSFSSVANQSAEFLKTENAKYIKEPKFSNLNLDQSGNVTFAFTGLIDANAISYASQFAPEPMLRSTPVATPVPTQSASSTTATSTASTTNRR